MSQKLGHLEEFSGPQGEEQTNGHPKEDCQKENKERESTENFSHGSFLILSFMGFIKIQGDRRSRHGV